MSVPASSSPLEIGRPAPLMWTSSSPTLWSHGSNSSIGAFPLSSGSSESCLELRELKVKNLRSKAEAQKKTLDELPPGLQNWAKTKNFDRFFEQVASQPETRKSVANFLVQHEHFDQLARLFKSLDKSILQELENHVLNELEKLPEEVRIHGLIAYLEYYKIVASNFSETHENDLTLEKDSCGMSGRLRRLSDVYNRLVGNHSLLKSKFSTNAADLSKRSSTVISESILAAVASKIKYDPETLKLQVAEYDQDSRSLASDQAEFSLNMRRFELAFDSFVYYFQKYIRKCQGHGEEERLTFRDKIGPLTFRLIHMEFQRDIERTNGYLQHQKEGVYLDNFGHFFSEAATHPCGAEMFKGESEELQLINDQMRKIRLETQEKSFKPELPRFLLQLNTFILMRALIYLNVEVAYKQFLSVKASIEEMASQPRLTPVEAHRIEVRLGLPLKTIGERDLKSQNKYQKDLTYYNTHLANWNAFRALFTENYQEIIYWIDTYMHGGKDPRTSLFYRNTTTLDTHKKLDKIPQEIDVLTLERSLK